MSDDNVHRQPEDVDADEPREVLTPDAVIPAETPPVVDEPTQYFIDLSIVFNDPNLYGLRISLDGPAAKIFAGLEFEIMYKKVSDTVGVYQSQLKLPDVMRTFTIGAYSITLPVFAIAVYTNGDFTVDIGFPWNEDFSRSFNIQGIVPPGIPVTGSGGFYFGKLSSATSSQVPKIISGTFNPVVIFGFGLTVGVGKSIDMGILKAGFSITVFGIVQGVVAKYNPYVLGQTGNAPKSQMQGSYYFWLQGTVGVIGKLYGTVDFAIIKASLDIELKVYLQITCESYADVPISVVASVDVSLSLKIIFFTIHLSFRAEVKATFTIKNPMGDPPWTLAPSATTTSMRARHLRTLRAAQLHADVLVSDDATLDPHWKNLAPAAQTMPLIGHLVPVLAAVGDGATLADQRVAYSLILLLESMDQQDDGTANGTTSFELLALQVARWLVAAALPEQQIDAADVDQLLISDRPVTTDCPATPGTVDLGPLVDYLVSSDDAPMPIPADSIDAFMAAQFDVTLDVVTENSTGSDSPTTVLAMIPELQLTVPTYPPPPKPSDADTDLVYRFSQFNSLASGYLEQLRTYFDQLAVQVQQERGATGRAETADVAAGPSMATFVFADEFLLIGRQMVRGVQDALRNYQLPVPAASPADTVATINANAHLDANGTGCLAPYTVAELFEANKDHPLTGGKSVTISGVTYRPAASDTFDSVTRHYGSVFTGHDLGTANATTEGMLHPGGSVRIGSGQTAPISGGDTLGSLAASYFDGSVPDLVTANIDRPGVLQALSTMVVPPLPVTIVDDDTLAKLAQRLAVPVDVLADGDDPTSPATTAALFASVGTSTMLSVPHLAQYPLGLLLGSFMAKQGLKHLSGMCGRYMLHGMRPITDGITWTGPRPPCADRPTCGLYSLTGQQFDIPELNDTDPFNFSISNPAALKWVTFADGASSLDVSVAPHTPAASAIDAVRTYATTTVLAPETSQLGALPLFDRIPAQFNMSSATGWEAGGTIPLAFGAKPADAPRALALWSFPDNLINLPDPSRGPVTMALQVGTYNESTGKMDNVAAPWWGWGTRVAVTIKKVEAIGNSATSRFTYELVGTNAYDIVLLERLLEATQATDAVIETIVLLSRPGSSGSGSGMQSADLSKVRFGIAQANLSTFTHPPALAANVVGADAPPPRHRTEGCLNDAYDFVRMLWEASITRSGGFTLYYNEVATGAGFGESVFNDKGEATLELVIGYAPPTAGDRTTAGYMNTAITGTYVDPSGSTVFAMSDPQPTTVTFGADDSLESVARFHYMNPIDLAVENSLVALAATVMVDVTRGTYLVGATRSGALSDIVSYVGFGVTADDVKRANPLITDWSAPLPANAVVRLPRVPVDSRSGPGGASLANLDEIADRYGAAVADLAADNLTTRALFADPLAASGGPHTRSATVPPGTVAIGASRVVPPDIPAPTDPTFAESYLLHAYTMLGYGIAANLWWPTASNQGLPLGPSDPADGSSNTEATSAGPVAPGVNAFAVPATKEAGEVWNYSQSVKIVNGLQTGPYVAIGDIMQLDFSWVDLFGNTILTSLDQPGRPATNLAPIPIGYLDDLVALSVWPSIASSYLVYDAGGVPTFRIELRFTTASYDPGTNETLDPLAEIPGWQRNAQQALVVYTHLLYQLNDGGTDPVVALSWSSGVLTAPVPVTGTDRDDLVGWLDDIAGFLQKRADGDDTTPFTSDHGCIPVKVTSTFEVELDPPVDPTLFVLSSTIGAVTDEQVVELQTTFCMDRRSDNIDAGFRDTPSVFSASTSIHPHLTKQDSNGVPVADTDQGAYTLDIFARLLEVALEDPGSHALKLAAGADRSRVTEATSDQPVWLVRVGLAANQSIGFAITDEGHPILYAPRPVSNELISQDDVDIYGYTTGAGISPTPTQKLNFSGVDIDMWMNQYLVAIDDVLSPEYLTAAQIIGAGTVDYIGRLLAAKETIAGSLKQLVMAVLSQEHSPEDLTDAQDAFEQQLLVRLANAYTTNAVIQFHATVDADLGQAACSPQLYGLPAATGGVAHGGAADVSLSAAKIALTHADSVAPNRLTFLMATRPGRDQGLQDRLASYVELDLQFAATAIEHQIDELPGIEGYKASSWLSFVRPLAQTPGDPLTEPLGTFKVPLVLRAFPTPPVLPSQGFAAVADPAGGHPAPPPPPLSELLQWNFSFEYGEDFHYPQDETYCTIKFNTFQGDETLEGIESVFAALAQFVTVYPDVAKDLRDLVAKVTASTTGKSLDDARTALLSFIELVTGVSSKLAGGPPTIQSAQVLRASVDYKVYVRESATKVDFKGQERDALLVSLYEVDGRPAGVGEPSIVIAGYDAQPAEQVPSNALAAWTYSDDDGPLEPSIGASIARRKVVVPALNVLDKQDALASAFLIRNKDLVPGVQTAKEFWYTTGEIAFADPLYPTLDWQIEIDVAKIGSSTPVTRSLADQLQNMFVELLTNAPASGQQLQLECRYEYRVQSDLPPISVPVLFLPPMNFILDNDGKIPAGGCPGNGQGNALCQVVGGIVAWFDANPPSPAQGRLVFDLAMFSHTPPPSPLLRLRTLTLALADLDPPLAASQETRRAHG